MDTTKLAAWLGHPAHLALGLVMLAVDIVTAASWITGAGGILTSWELHLFLLVVSVPLTVLCLCGWVATHPRRPTVRFLALHDEIAACRDLVLAADTDPKKVDVMGRLLEMRRKLAPLGVSPLLIRELSDSNQRSKTWGELASLASFAVVGDIKTARSRWPAPADKAPQP